MLHMMILKRHRVRKEVSHLMRFLEGPQPNALAFRNPCKAKENEMRNAVLIEKQRREQYQRMVPGQKDFPKKQSTELGSCRKLSQTARLGLTMIFLSHLLCQYGFLMGFTWVSYGFHISAQGFLCPCHDQGRGGSVLAGRGSSLHGSRGAAKGHEGKERQEGQLGPTTGPMGANGRGRSIQGCNWYRGSYGKWMNTRMDMDSMDRRHS